MEAGREKGLGYPEPIVLKIPSSAEYILLARLVISCVGRLAGFEPEDIYDLKLSVTEAATNVIRHAEVDSFLIKYRVIPEAVEITVIDEGGGFDIEGFSEQRGEHGGFGLAVIQSLVDEVILDSTVRGGTRLKMIRRRTPMGRISQP
ncbi:MAG: ATP-binding protein [Rubrobacter sp.]|nr:ATP-binding protein [Rubrobacter sp.]